MTNERGVLVCVKFKARRMVSQPANVFRGAAHQAIRFADEPAMRAAADRLEETEDQKFRCGRFEKGKVARVEQITDKKSRKESFASASRSLRGLRSGGRLRQEAITEKRLTRFSSYRIAAKIGLGESGNPIAIPLD